MAGRSTVADGRNMSESDCCIASGRGSGFGGGGSKSLGKQTVAALRTCLHLEIDVTDPQPTPFIESMQSETRDTSQTQAGNISRHYCGEGVRLALVHAAR
jgi:hypothetical protein